MQWRAWMVTLGIVAAGLSPCPGHAAFEIRPVSAAERGCGTALALGLVPGSPHVPGPGEGGCCVGAVGCHAFRPFGLAGIGFGRIWLLAPVAGKRASAAGWFQRLGTASYVEETFGAGCLLAIGPLGWEPMLRFGLVRLEGAVVDRAAVCDLAVTAHPSPGISVRVSTQNPLGLALMGNGETCPVELRVGCGYLVSKRLAWAGEISKQRGYPTAITTGVEFVPTRGLALRAGLGSDPREVSLGLGLALRGLTVDVATSINLDLGATHEAGVIYRWR